jgi:hypothetical protein
VCLMDLGKDITLKIIVCKQHTSQYWLGNKLHSWQLWIAFVSLSVEMNFTQKLTLTPVLPWGLDSLLSFIDTYNACRTVVIRCWHIHCLQNCCYSLLTHTLPTELLFFADTYAACRTIVILCWHILCL